MSLMSGNTYGAIFFSDGKRWASMMPEFTLITKCKKCHFIFWLNELNQKGSYDFNDPNYESFEHIDDAEFLEISDYVMALNNLDTIDTNHEAYIRRQIWWGYNDRHRRNEIFFLDDNDKNVYYHNCNRLIELLDNTDENHIIMIAELYRNTEQYDKSLKLLNSLKNPDFNWVVAPIHKECLAKNPFVFEIKD